MDKLVGLPDPETKRKIIGNEFVYVFDDEANKLEGVDFLAQGIQLGMSDEIVWRQPFPFVSFVI